MSKNVCMEVLSSEKLTAWLCEAAFSKAEILLSVLNQFSRLQNSSKSIALAQDSLFKIFFNYQSIESGFLFGIQNSNF